VHLQVLLAQERRSGARAAALLDMDAWVTAFAWAARVSLVRGGCNRFA